METGSISGAAAPASAPRTDRGLGTLKSEDFFRLLISEMQQQDPLEPAKTGDLIGQVSQLRSIELSSRMTDSLDALSRNQRTSGSSELLGKYVFASSPGADGSAQLVSGVVSGVLFSDSGEAVLELDTGQSVLSSTVQRVTTLAQAEAEGTAVPPAILGGPPDPAAKLTGAAAARRVDTPVGGAEPGARPPWPGLFDWLKPGPQPASPRRRAG